MRFVPARATRPVRARLLDPAILVCVAALTWAPPIPDGPAGAGPWAGVAGMLAVGAVIIAGRRAGAEAPAAAAAAAGVTVWALSASGRFASAGEPTNLLMSLAPAFLTYAGHLYGRDRRRAWTMVVLLGLVAVHPWATSQKVAADGLLYVCAPMLFGFYREARQMLVRTLTDRARDAERERDLCAEQARVRERTRMAVELHDVVTHRVSLMVLHAGALRMTAADRAVRETAEKLRATGCEALVELRELIGVLRGSEASARERNIPPPPAPVAAGALSPETPPRIDRSDRWFAAAAGAWTLLISTLVASVPPTGAGEPVLPWLEIALQLPLAAALVLRRRRPHAAAAPTLAGTAVLLVLAVTGAMDLPVTGGSTRLVLPATAPLAAYCVAAYSRRPGLGAAMVAALLLVAVRPWAPHAAVVSVGAVFIGLPALLGLYAGAWRRLVAALTERAERAKRERWLLEGRARAEERARLAREMHAIVSGRVNDMLGCAERLGGASPSAEIAQAHADLVANGRRALDELHHLVGAFQSGDAAAETADGPGGPAGLAGLAGLAAESASVGVPVELVEEGDPAAASPAIIRTAHRIVGEALTNVRKHAHGAHVRVAVRYLPDQVRVRVSNGRPPAGPYRGERELAAGGSGTGLLGVRQRVELVDGTLVARATEDGGFVIDAILPAYVPTSSHPQHPTPQHQAPP
ncbi:histidine kinase [Actinomadura luteofluorescens]|uniref:sensor histidine kinase n=1 Tax=Actinomadura luteofluorescens TaxID=46163 RepID=UPI003D9330A5